MNSAPHEQHDGPHEPPEGRQDENEYLSEHIAKTTWQGIRAPSPLPQPIFTPGNWVTFYNHDESIAEGVIIRETSAGLEYWPVESGDVLTNDRWFIPWHAFESAWLVGDAAHAALLKAQQQRAKGATADAE